jgi:PIN domain nuclease of toxin-antitoxin system
VRLLIDTHVFLWWDRQLQWVPAKLRSAIEDDANDVFVSTATVWEIAIKRAIGKLEFTAPIVETIERLRFGLLPIAGSHAEYAGDYRGTTTIHSIA